MSGTITLGIIISALLAVALVAYIIWICCVIDSALNNLENYDDEPY